ncbi:MAG: hypothetical protein ACTTJH_05340 [Bacteroidales bacterium]
MKRFICVLLSVVIAFCILSCKSPRIVRDVFPLRERDNTHSESIVAKNYFFNDETSVTNDREEFVVFSQSEFDKYFSPATFMGTEGVPTPIDFDKQIALCIVLDQTDIDKKLDFIEITSDNNGNITCNYRLTIGKKLSFMIQPCLIILFDKNKATKKIDFHRVLVR